MASKAFTNCEKLQQLSIAEGVEEIKDYAFNECALTELVIPDSVQKIGKKAFNGCSKLAKVVLAEDLKNSLDSSVFSGCSSAQFFPSGASAVEAPANEAPVVEALVEATTATPASDVEAGTSAATERKLYYMEVLSDTTCVIVNYKGDEAVVRIPSELQKGGKSYKVVEIGKLAFAKKKTPGKIVWTEEHVNHADEYSVTIIPEVVDPNYKGYQTIREVVVPEGVKTISEAAFYGCECLEKVQLPQSLEKLGGGAFAFCKQLKSVSLPDAVSTIPEHAFEYCENM